MTFTYYTGSVPICYLLMAIELCSYLLVDLWMFSSTSFYGCCITMMIFGQIFKEVCLSPVSTVELLPSAAEGIVDRVFAA
jgi:hypothetical protein